MKAHLADHTTKAQMRPFVCQHKLISKCWNISHYSMHWVDQCVTSRHGIDQSPNMSGHCPRVGNTPVLWLSWWAEWKADSSINNILCHVNIRKVQIDRGRPVQTRKHLDRIGVWQEEYFSAIRCWSDDPDWQLCDDIGRTAEQRWYQNICAISTSVIPDFNMSVIYIYIYLYIYL